MPIASPSGWKPSSAVTPPPRRASSRGVTARSWSRDCRTTSASSIPACWSRRRRRTMSAPDDGLFASDGLTAEIGGYIVQARRADAWDAIVGLLAELSAGQADCFHALMERMSATCPTRAASSTASTICSTRPTSSCTMSPSIGRIGVRRGGSSPPPTRAPSSRLARQARPRIGENPIAAAWFRQAEAGEAAGLPIGLRSAPPVAELPAASAPLDPTMADAADAFARAVAAELLAGASARPARRRSGERWRIERSPTVDGVPPGATPRCRAEAWAGAGVPRQYPRGRVPPPVAFLHAGGGVTGRRGDLQPRSR